MAPTSTVGHAPVVSANKFSLEEDVASPRKGFVEGAHRLIAPIQTLERTLPLMPVTGVTRLANLTGLDILGIPVVMAIRPNARSLAVSSGKGPTLEAAKASALMEAVEYFHAERVRLPLRLGSFNELRHRYDLIDLERLPRLSVSRFHEDLPILWVEGHDLLGDAPCWLPYELAHTNFSLPLPTGSGCFPMSSNGLASGNDPMEAVSHGITEVVERDAMTLWHRLPDERRRGRRIDLETIDDPVARALIERFHHAGIAVGLWNMTSDLSLAAFECVIVDREDDVFRRLYATSGTGCHPSRNVAAVRALAEAAQGRMIYIAGSRDDRDREAYESARDPQLTRGARDRILDESEPRAAFASVPTREHASFVEDVRYELELLEAAGIEEVVAVDLAWPELGVAVVRVVIPGLEGIGTMPGYVPGARVRALLA